MNFKTREEFIQYVRDNETDIKAALVLELFKNILSISVDEWVEKFRKGAIEHDNEDFFTLDHKKELRSEVLDAISYFSVIHARNSL